MITTTVLAITLVTQGPSTVASQAKQQEIMASIKAARAQNPVEAQTPAQLAESNAKAREYADRAHRLKVSKAEKTRRYRAYQAAVEKAIKVEQSRIYAATHAPTFAESITLQRSRQLDSRLGAAKR